MTNKMIDPGLALMLDQTSLQQGANDVRQLSASLDSKLKAVQEWLGNLEGRVATEIVLPHPDNTELEFGLRLSGPPWKLDFRYLPVGRARSMQEAMMRQTEWEPLLSASLTAKMIAATAIPVLFKAMRDAQLKFIAKLRNANSTIDFFAEQVGLSKREGA